MLIDLQIYTLAHVVISVLGILSGLIAAGGFLSGTSFPRITSAFLIATLITTISGFGFPFSKVTPAHVVGVISLFTLTGAFIALYAKKLAGGWRRTFVVLCITSLYLNVFVLLAQLLQKIPALAAIAPTPASPAFAASQGLVLLIFVLLGHAALKGFTHQAVA